MEIRIILNNLGVGILGFDEGDLVDFCERKERAREEMGEDFEEFDGDEIPEEELEEMDDFVYIKVGRRGHRVVVEFPER